jgi:hypothetical protein
MYKLWSLYYAVNSSPLPLLPYYIQILSSKSCSETPSMYLPLMTETTFPCTQNKRDYQFNWIFRLCTNEHILSWHVQLRSTFPLLSNVSLTQLPWKRFVILATVTERRKQLHAFKRSLNRYYRNRLRFYSVVNTDFNYILKETATLFSLSCPNHDS